jgi:hypothetical protein
MPLDPVACIEHTSPAYARPSSIVRTLSHLASTSSHFQKFWPSRVFLFPTNHILKTSSTCLSEHVLPKNVCCNNAIIIQRRGSEVYTDSTTAQYSVQVRGSVQGPPLLSSSEANPAVFHSYQATESFKKSGEIFSEQRCEQLRSSAALGFPTLLVLLYAITFLGRPLA